MTRVTETASFDPELFDFLRDLAKHNDRAWFNANKARYEGHVLEPALAFIEDFGYRLESISPHFRADTRKTGGSLFRIYRDTRFAKDKTPYKTNTGMHFRHKAAKDAHAPGFYLHLAPGQVFGGGGIWHPDTKTATKIRQAIVDDPERWRAATREPPFTDRVARRQRQHAQARPDGLRRLVRVRRRPAPPRLLRLGRAERGEGDDARLPRRVHACVRGGGAAREVHL